MAKKATGGHGKGKSSRRSDGYYTDNPPAKKSPAKKATNPKPGPGTGDMGPNVRGKQKP